MIEGVKIKIAGDYSLNIINSFSLEQLKEMSFDGAMLSYEMNLEQIKSLKLPNTFEVELGVYGRIPVMTSEYCPIGSTAGNKAPGNCTGACRKDNYYLKDRMGARFPLVGDSTDCRCTIFYSSALFAPDIVKKAGDLGLDYIRLSFVDESPKEIYDIVNLHRSLLENRESKFTETIERIKAKGFTKGHFSRGV
jgi:putative protease